MNFFRDFWGFIAEGEDKNDNLYKGNHNKSEYFLIIIELLIFVCYN